MDMYICCLVSINRCPIVYTYTGKFSLHAWLKYYALLTKVEFLEIIAIYVPGQILNTELLACSSCCHWCSSSLWSSWQHRSCLGHTLHTIYHSSQSRWGGGWGRRGRDLPSGLCWVNSGRNTLFPQRTCSRLKRSGVKTLFTEKFSQSSIKKNV